MTTTTATDPAALLKRYRAELSPGVPASGSYFDSQIQHARGRFKRRQTLAAMVLQRGEVDVLENEDLVAELVEDRVVTAAEVDEMRAAGEVRREQLSAKEDNRERYVALRDTRAQVARELREYAEAELVAAIDAEARRRLGEG